MIIPLDKRLHFICAAMGTFFIYLFIHDLKLTGLIACCVWLLDEMVYQRLNPYRTSDVGDLMADFAGTAFALLAIALL